MAVNSVNNQQAWQQYFAQNGEQTTPTTPTPPNQAIAFKGAPSADVYENKAQEEAAQGGNGLLYSAIGLAAIAAGICFGRKGYLGKSIQKFLGGAVNDVAKAANGSIDDVTKKVSEKYGDNVAARVRSIAHLQGTRAQALEQATKAGQIESIATELKKLKAGDALSEEVSANLTKLGVNLDDILVDGKVDATKFANLNQAVLNTVNDTKGAINHLTDSIHNSDKLLGGNTTFRRIVTDQNGKIITRDAIKGEIALQQLANPVENQRIALTNIDEVNLLGEEATKNVILRNALSNKTFTSLLDDKGDVIADNATNLINGLKTTLAKVTDGKVPQEAREQLSALRALAQEKPNVYSDEYNAVKTLVKGFKNTKATPTA